MSTLPGGTAMTLGGTGAVLDNQGTIDANAAGSLVLARALSIGNLYTPGGGVVAVTNKSSIEGTFDGTFGLAGAAAVIANTATTSFNNSGSIGTSALGAFDPINAIAVAVYGGGNVNFVNTGMVTGRVSFASPAAGGNAFVNAGTINGSVTLGTAPGGNRFTAVTGSQINGGVAPSAEVTLQTPAATPSFLRFAVAGTVDAGAGGTDTLVLQNSVAGPGSGSAGTGTVSSPQYLNFEKLVVNSGTWTLNGPVVSGSTLLRGGVALFDNAQSFGTGTLTSDGGAIEAAVAGLTLAQPVALAAGLTVQGANGLTLGGSINGNGGLIKNGTGTLTLSGSNDFSGGLALNAGGLTLGTAASLGTGLFIVGGPVALNTAFTGTLANNVQLGDALVLNGAGALTLVGNIVGDGSLTIVSGNLALRGDNHYTGGTVLQAGSVDAGNGSVFGTGDITVDGAVAMTGAAGVAIGNNVVLDNTLNFGAGGDGGALTLGGKISGAGGISLAGAPGLTLNGANTFSGGFNLGGGALTVGNDTALGTGAVTVSGASSLAANAAVSLVNAVNLNATLTVGGGAGGELAMNGAIGGLRGIVKTGASRLTLGHANTFAGGVNLQDGNLRVGTNTSLGGGALTVNGAATLDSSAGVAVGNAVVLNAKLTVGGPNTIALGGPVSGAGGLGYDGTATLALTGANTFGGGVSLAGGTLSLGTSTSMGTGTLDVTGKATLVNGAALTLANAVTLGARLTVGGATDLTFDGTVSGGGSLVKTGAGALALTKANSFGGGVLLQAGTLGVGHDTALGAGVVTVGGASTLTASTNVALANGIVLDAGLGIAGASNLTLGGTVAGKGGLAMNGTGTLALNGDNSYAGPTVVAGGTLHVGNTSGSATGAGMVTVQAGAVLSGNGRIGGNVVLDTGAVLAPGATAAAMGTLTVGGDLSLANGSVLSYQFGAPGPNFSTAGQSDSVSVGGNFGVGGTATLQVSDAGGFGPGVYRVADYGGTFTGGTLALAPVPGAALSLQNLTADKRVMIVNTTGLTLNFWNADGLAGPAQSGGGSGTWSVASPVWTDAAGSVSAAMQPQPGFAIFGGAAGNVAVDNTGGAVAASGIQFANDGYRLSGNILTLTATKAAPGPVEVRVGDGSASSAAWTASIANVIAGTAGLRKTGAGTLELTAANTYTGGTTLDAGTLSVASDAALGDAAGALTFNGGAIKVTGSAFSTLSRGITFGAGGGTFNVDSPFNTLEVASAVGGTGGLVKTGGGTLLLSQVSTYAGGTSVAAGSLEVPRTGAVSDGPVSVAAHASLIFSGSADAGTLAIDLAERGSSGNAGFIVFRDKSSVGSAKLTMHTGAVAEFGGTASAGNAVIENLGGLSNFTGNSTAGTARITNHAGGQINLADNANAGQAHLTNLSGGLVDFFDTATADQATVINNAGGRVRISLLGANGVSIGSLSGAGNVLLGTKTLTTGGLNTDTEVSGVISGNGGSLVKVGTGALTLSGANTYTGGTSLRQGRLNVGHSQALGTGALSMDDDTTLGFSADGVVLANAVKLTGQNDPVIDTGAFSATLAGAISGGGFITKQGTGTLTLSGANTYTGATNVAQGTLKAGAANTFSAASAHSVAAGATLDLAGFNQGVASLANSGTVSLVGAVAGTTLTVNGNYVGNNGVLKLGTALSGTGPSDRLVINGGTASGKTSVQVTNLGGLGALTAGNGIEVVTAQGGATTTAQTTKDAFSLAGGHVDAGAYEYRLYAADASGAGENWFLRSSIPAVAQPTSPGAPGVPIVTYRPEASLFASLPSQLRQGNLAMLGDLRKRVGDDDVKGTATALTGSERRAWARVLSTDVDIQQGGAVSPNSKGRLTGFQAGTDLLATSNWRAGLYVGQLDGDARVRGFASGIQNLAVGRNDLRSQYVGVYGTYTGDNGFYADAVVQSGRHRYTVEPLLSFGTGGKGNSLLGSIEVGQAFALGGSGWSVEPQLQLIHQHMDLGNSVITGAVVQPQADNGWIARAGVRLKGQLDTGVGTLQPYGRFNVYKTSSGADIARFVNGATTTDIAAPTGGTSSELAGGFTLALSPSTSLYGELGKLWASGGNAKVKSWVNGSFGVRVKW